MPHAAENTELAAQSTDELRRGSARHNWRQFADMTDTAAGGLRVITRGEGCYLYDSDGNRFLDALSNLFCVNVGYSFGAEFGEAAARQYTELGYHANWSSAHPRAIELAARVADLAPEGLNHVLFTPGGGDGVEACWKIARQYFRLKGENRFKAISRYMAYHGVSMGALSLTGVPFNREPFEPLVPGAVHVRNTKRYGRPAGETEEEFTAFLLDDMEAAIVQEGPSTVAMVIIEPVQNNGGVLVPPKGYAEGIRALCDKYGILLVADETITGYGRLGTWFGSQRIGLKPDLLTSAKALSSAQAVIGAVVASDKVFEPFARSGGLLRHGHTFGAHPVMCAVALKNLEIMERIGCNGHVLAREAELRSDLEQLLDLPVVGDVRGLGFYYAIELKPGKADGSPYSPEDHKKLFGDDSRRIETGLAEHGVLTRVATAESVIITVCPPLVADTAEFGELAAALHAVLKPVADDYAAL